MKIVWTAKAKDDAAKVLQYTRETFGARQFVKVRDFLRGVPAFLRQSPRAAPMEQALIFTGEEYRALLFRPRIKVIYRIDNTDSITIVRIWNTYQDPSSILPN